MKNDGFGAVWTENDYCFRTGIWPLSRFILKAIVNFFGYKIDMLKPNNGYLFSLFYPGILIKIGLGSCRHFR